ncbi:MAG: hypothetical protein IPJ41_11730 [Phycisphaerales bacterium]|nr:hypothetical protein [Phycisphaerales bacterium]
MLARKHATGTFDIFELQGSLGDHQSELALDAEVAIVLQCTGGSRDRPTLRLAGGDAETLAIEPLEAIVRWGGSTAFSIRVGPATAVIPAIAATISAPTAEGAAARPAST